MNTNNILSADLLDLIFDDRNKEYGAYELRKTYQKRITKALLITTGIAVLIFTGTVLASSFKPPVDKTFVINEIELTKIPEKVAPPPEPERRPEPKPVRQQAFVEPIIVDDPQVDEPAPDLDDLRNAKISNITTDGPDFTDIVEPGDIDGQTNVIEVNKNAILDEPYRTVEVEAKFNGNWVKFLERNLVGEIPVDHGAPAGRYKVMIQFVVDLDGTVSDIQALSNNGYGMEEEAIRVLKKAAKWEPAIQNGHPVKAYRKQSIVFDVLDQ